MTVKHKPHSLVYDAETTRPGEQTFAEPDPLSAEWKRDRLGYLTDAVDDDDPLEHARWLNRRQAARLGGAHPLRHSVEVFDPNPDEDAPLGVTRMHYSHSNRGECTRALIAYAREMGFVGRDASGAESYLEQCGEPESWQVLWSKGPAPQDGQA